MCAPRVRRGRRVWVERRGSALAGADPAPDLDPDPDRDRDLDLDLDLDLDPDPDPDLDLDLDPDLDPDLDLDPDRETDRETEAAEIQRVALRLRRMLRAYRCVTTALRSAKSACLNSAEGAGRVTRADKARSFAIARAEAVEAAAGPHPRRASPAPGDSEWKHAQ